jgi:hypothetical protein
LQCGVHAFAECPSATVFFIHPLFVCFIHLLYFLLPDFPATMYTAVTPFLRNKQSLFSMCHTLSPSSRASSVVLLLASTSTSSHVHVHLFPSLFPTPLPPPTSPHFRRLPPSYHV